MIEVFSAVALLSDSLTIHAFLSSANFFQNHFFGKSSFRNIIKMSNSLDTDHLIWVQTVLQRLSSVDTSVVNVELNIC